MGKNELALALAADLKRLAGSIEAYIGESEVQETPVKAPAAEKPEGLRQVTIEEVRAILAEKSQSGKQPQVKALITKYGANKLTDIDPDKFGQMVADAEGI